MTTEEQEQRDAIRWARMAKSAAPWVSEWCEFEKGVTIAKFRTDSEVVTNPVKAIEYQQYLSALERLRIACLGRIESVKENADD